MAVDTLYTNVAIVGPGLIGGSMGIALRRRGVAEKVVGIGRRESSLQEAHEVGAVDKTTLDLETGVDDADLVVLATPIRAISKLMPSLANAMASGAVLTEVASTKRSVIGTIQQGLTQRSDITLIPTHPMAGSEHRGAPHATEDLFEKSVCIFTPLPDTPSNELKKLEHLWTALGTTIREMTPEEHDRTVAAVSHLPHLAASCVARCVNRQQGQFAGGGYTDTTRIASGDPRLWRDICESNADEVNAAVETLIERLQELRSYLSRDQFDEVQQFLADAKQKRDSIIEDLSN